jgi:hypothetical protein
MSLESINHQFESEEPWLGGVSMFSGCVNYPTAKAGGLPSPAEAGRASGPVDGGPPPRRAV